MWHNYIIARDLDDAARLLDEHRGNARIVAGATDLIVEIERKVRAVKTLIDLTRIPNLNYLKSEHIDDTEWIRLGALVTHNQACASELIQQKALPLAQASWEVGAPQIRNRATIAGNLITASPANDTITPLMALDAVVFLKSKSRGVRTVALRDFYTGVRKTVLSPDELLTEIAFPALKPNERGVFIKLALRRAQAISVVNVTAIIEYDSHANKRIVRARLALGCVAPTIVRCDEAEEFLIGKTLDEITIERAGQLAQRAAKPIDDIRSSAEYRMAMVRVIVMRALRAIANDEARGALPEKPVLLSTEKNPKSSIDTQPQKSITLNVNGKHRIVMNAHNKTLLRMLREDLGLTGTKEGCAEGECGACTAFMNGDAVMSCLVPAPAAHGAKIETIESLANNDRLHPLQQAFIDEAAVQCGYCTPGFLMSGAMLLEEVRQPTQSEIEQAIAGNLCRCTGYYKILDAFKKMNEMSQ